MESTNLAICFFWRGLMGLELQNFWFLQVIFVLDGFIMLPPVCSFPLVSTNILWLQVTPCCRTVLNANWKGRVPRYRLHVSVCAHRHISIISSIYIFLFVFIYKHSFWIDIHWVLPPPCKGFTFWFNRGFLLPSLWDCYRLGAVPKIYTSSDYGHAHIFIFTFRHNIRRSSKISSQVSCFTEFQPSNHYPFGN